MRLFRHRKREDPRELEALQRDERAVFDALLAGDGSGMAALRQQVEHGFHRGLVRQSFSWSYQVMLVVDEAQQAAEAIPSRPTLELDDLVVHVEELPEPLSARASVSDGVFYGFSVDAPGRTHYPSHLTFTDMAYRQRDGSVGTARDPSILEEFEHDLTMPVAGKPAPEWLRDAIPDALRRAPQPETAMPEDVERHGHHDAAVLARYVTSTDFGEVTLLGGQEYFLTDDDELVVANGLDGSAYTVTRQGQVRHFPLDRSPPQDCGSLRAWLRRLPEDG